MSEPPKDLASVTASILTSQQKRVQDSQTRAGLSPADIKVAKQEARIAKMPWGPSVSFEQREVQLRRMKAATTKQMQTRSTARGQVQMVGSLQEKIER